jgi:hypothetical protein
VLDVPPWPDTVMPASELLGRLMAAAGEDTTLVVVSDHGFKLGEGYEPGLPVVVDPVLDYSTYLGGSGTEYGHGIVVDAFGEIYVTGQTSSTEKASGYRPSLEVESW